MILIVQNGLKSFTDFSELCDAFFRKKKKKKIRQQKTCLMILIVLSFLSVFLLLYRVTSLHKFNNRDSNKYI